MTPTAAAAASTPDAAALRTARTARLRDVVRMSTGSILELLVHGCRSVLENSTSRSAADSGQTGCNHRHNTQHHMSVVVCRGFAVGQLAEQPERCAGDALLRAAPVVAAARCVAAWGGVRGWRVADRGVGGCGRRVRGCALCAQRDDLSGGAQLGERPRGGCPHSVVVVVDQTGCCAAGCPRAPTSTWERCASLSSRTASTPCPASSMTGTQPTASTLPSVASTGRVCPRYMSCPLEGCARRRQQPR